MTIHEAIASIMKEGGAISKDKKNLQQGFMYRGIDDVMNTFQPLMAKHGVFVVPEVLEQTREDRTSSKGNALIYSILKMRYTFYSADGTSVSAVVIGEGMDSGDKASNKAMAVAMKYAMFQVFCIPTEEMEDPDKESHEVKPAKVPKPAANPAEKELPPLGNGGMWYCSDCGKPVEPFRTAAGKTVTPKTIVERSVKECNKALCYACLEKLMTVKNA